MRAALARTQRQRLLPDFSYCVIAEGSIVLIKIHLDSLRRAHAQ